MVNGKAYETASAGRRGYAAINIRILGPLCPIEPAWLGIRRRNRFHLYRNSGTVCGPDFAFISQSRLGNFAMPDVIIDWMVTTIRSETKTQDSFSPSFFYRNADREDLVITPYQSIDSLHNTASFCELCVAIIRKLKGYGLVKRKARRNPGFSIAATQQMKQNRNDS